MEQKLIIRRKNSSAMKFVFACTFLFLMLSLSAQDSTKTINLEDLEVDHPMLVDQRFKNLFNYDLDSLVDLSDRKENEIKTLFYSMGMTLKKDTCLKVDDKDHLVESLDSLKLSFNHFLDSAHEVDYLSYGHGRQAGRRSLIFRIITQDNFLFYLRYWFSSWYYAYLEPGVFECHKQE